MSDSGNVVGTGGSGHIDPESQPDKQGQQDPAKKFQQGASSDADKDDQIADEMSEQSFPSSDPPSTWAGSDPS